MPEYHFRPWKNAEDTHAIYTLAAWVAEETMAAAALPYQLSSWATDDPQNLESRTHRSLGESEASLLGVVTTDSGIMTAAPIAPSKQTTGLLPGRG